MLGSLIAYVREKKGISKTSIADITGINVGHLSHIEKGERNPSQSSLRDICKALDIPYQQLSYTFDKKLTEDQKKFNLIQAVPYNTVPLVSAIEEIIDCPSSIPNASIAFRMPDDTMKSVAPKGTPLFVEFGSIPDHREIGLFKYENSILVRRLLYRKNKLILKADSLLTKDIIIEDLSKFVVIGKVFAEK